MKERAAAATKQIETTTDSKADIGDSRPMNIANSTAGSPQFPLTTPKGNTQCLSKVPKGPRPFDASSKKYSREPARSPHTFSPPSTAYPPFPSLVQSHWMPSQVVQAKEPHDNRDRPFALPKNRKQQKSSRVGLRLYRGDEDEDARKRKRKDEELDAHFVDDDGQWDTPYMPGSEADNRRYCLTWLRNVPKPGSFQAQDAPPKRE